MDQLPTYFSGIVGLLLLSSFVKIVTALSIVRVGLGLSGSGMGVVVIAVSLALSLVVMGPQVERLGGGGAVIAGRVTPIGALEPAFAPFLQKHTDPDVAKALEGLAQKLNRSTSAEAVGDVAEKGSPDSGAFGVKVAAFIISELRSAFYIGLIVIVPFLVVDLIVANVLMALGVVQMSALVISIPLKLLLFVAVDGWKLITEKLLGSYL